MGEHERAGHDEELAFVGNRDIGRCRGDGDGHDRDNGAVAQCNDYELAHRAPNQSLTSGR